VSPVPAHFCYTLDACPAWNALTSIIRCWAAFYKPLNLRDLQASPQTGRLHQDRLLATLCGGQRPASACSTIIAVRLLTELQDKIPPEDLQPTTTVNSIQCDVWSHYGVLLMLQRKVPQAIEIFDALYAGILRRQNATGKRFHKGLPLFHISQCYQTLGRIVHAKRYRMLALCEDAVSDKGALRLQNSGSYGRLAWVHGLSDPQIRSYATQAYAAYQENAAAASMPEWILQRFDQQWKTEVPSDQEAGTYHITKCYCERLIDFMHQFQFIAAPVFRRR
jgi:hypothetical protein